MTLKRWKKISEHLVVANPWWEYRRDEYELPSGKRGEYNYVHSNGSAMVLPVLTDGRIVCVNQYRYLCEKESIEFPCGGVKSGSTHDETARHELLEETGFSANRWLLIGEFNPFNGATDETCKVFVARDLHHVGAQPEETEEFEQMFLTSDMIDMYIRDGVIWDGMSLAAWCIARTKVL